MLWWIGAKKLDQVTNCKLLIVVNIRETSSVETQETCSKETPIISDLGYKLGETSKFGNWKLRRARRGSFTAASSVRSKRDDYI